MSAHLILIIALAIFAICLMTAAHLPKGPKHTALVTSAVIAMLVTLLANNTI